jgi:hypothetical protein
VVRHGGPRSVVAREGPLRSRPGHHSPPPRKNATRGAAASMTRAPRAGMSMMR